MKIKKQNFVLRPGKYRLPGGHISADAITSSANPGRHSPDIVPHRDRLPQPAPIIRGAKLFWPFRPLILSIHLNAKWILLPQLFRLIP